MKRNRPPASFLGAEEALDGITDAEDEVLEHLQTVTDSLAASLQSVHADHHVVTRSHKCMVSKYRQLSVLYPPRNLPALDSIVLLLPLSRVV